MTSLEQAIGLLQDMQRSGMPDNRWLASFVFAVSMRGDTAEHARIRGAVDAAQERKFEHETKFLLDVQDAIGFYVKTFENIPDDAFSTVLRAVVEVWLSRGYCGHDETKKLALATIRKAIKDNDAHAVLRGWTDREKFNWLARLYKSEGPSSDKWRAMYDDLADQLKNNPSKETTQDEQAHH